MTTTLTIEELEQSGERELGTSDWHEITQEQINLFAEATGDHQWIHVDPEAAANGPFGTTVAHGHDLAEEHRQHRQGQVPVRDGRAERAVRGGFGIDVDPLVVAGRLRERVDLLLRDVDPAGRPELVARLHSAGPQRTTVAAHV
jgi:hypothetical protein